MSSFAIFKKTDRERLKPVTVLLSADMDHYTCSSFACRASAEHYRWCYLENSLDYEVVPVNLEEVTNE